MRPAQELGLHVYVWDGAVSVDAAEACDSVLVSAGQAAAQRSATDCPRRLQGLPGFLRDNPAPRPDRVPFDLEELFGTVALDGGERGLYVQVRDGHVIIEQPGGSVHLGANETGYAAPGGERPLRVALAPGIIFEERYPRPEAFDPRVQRIIELFDDGGGTDIGGFGRLECTID